VQIGVANDADLAGDGINLFTYQFQQRGREVSGNELVGLGALQPPGKEGSI